MTLTAPRCERQLEEKLPAWSVARALAPLLAFWRRPRPLDPETLSEHWRRDLGLHELPADLRREELLSWARRDRP